MIQLHNVSLAFAGQQVLDDLSWTITPGAHIGLIGPNGAGKTTLLRLIDDRLSPDAGTVSAGKTTVGYLEQGIQEHAGARTVHEEALQAFGDVLALEEKERRITDQLAAADDPQSDAYEKLLHQLDRVQSRLNAREAHRIRSRTDAVLTGLGFDPDDLGRPLDTFSGGWRMRAALAKLLLGRPDVLLLDEPTNHLDIDSIDWLEGYLADYPGTVIIVSHDRYFLDRMVTSIAELAHGGITTYDGNYSYYLEARKERRAQQRAAYENQQRKIKEIQQFIDRFRYNASKAAQVQSRIKKLERMDRLKPPPSDTAEVHFEFPDPPRSGRVVLELSAFSKQYDTAEGPLPVFDEAGPLTIERGDKIALIGPNGAGKSTLARIIDDAEPFEGSREEGYKVQTTFFAQHQAEALDPGKTILETLREKAPRKDETELRSVAGAFLFTGEDVFKKISVLSGGEKSRVALARTLLQPANFLILDEPTNHLDIQSRGVLEEALNQYSGTFVIISHDRHFLDEVANTVWRVGDGDVDIYPGTYSDYRWKVEHGTGASPGEDSMSTSESTAPQQNGAPTKTQQHQQDTAANGTFAQLNSYQLKKKYEAAETAILEKEERQSELEDALSDASLYDDPDQARQVSQDYDALKAELAELYETWEALADHLMAQEEAS